MAVEEHCQQSAFNYLTVALYKQTGEKSTSTTHMFPQKQVRRYLQADGRASFLWKLGLDYAVGLDILPP